MYAPGQMAERTRVLIVDDEEMMRDLVSAMLPPEDYAVEAVDGGPSALAAIAARMPDLVLLDLYMPGMTGWEVIDRLKELASPPPVIAMSGLGTSEPPELHGVRRFVFGYLPKPFSHEQLVTTCQRALRAAALVTGQSQMSGENRKALRRTLLVGATLFSRDGTPAAVGQILNLSPAGAQIDLGAGLQPGMDMTLAFEIPGGQGPFRVKCRVQWRRDGKVGVTFIDLSPDDHKRLEDLLALS